MTDAETITVRPLAAGDRPRWSALLTAHGETYGCEMPADVVDTVWGWLMDPNTTIHGLAAVAETGQPVGIVHYQTMYRALVGRPSCYLSDLHVDSTWRGRGIGARLVKAVVAIAKRQGQGNVRWLVDDSNLIARRLYDRVATRTGFVLYEAEDPDSLGGILDSGTPELTRTAFSAGA
jgi:ribosomal protein S18 acetylase RimI-like enzyme